MVEVRPMLKRVMVERMLVGGGCWKKKNKLLLSYYYCVERKMTRVAAVSTVVEGEK